MTDQLIQAVVNLLLALSFLFDAGTAGLGGAPADTGSRRRGCAAAGIALPPGRGLPMRPRAVLILALALGLLSAPLAAEAQQAGKVPKIGLLQPGPRPPRMGGGIPPRAS
jgi:hypothetical protein